ncbi:gliding motility-associated-like protein [Chitinophaga dinghuensis]|uniref:Gliding motility-associated-like protein n=2 Tax=Chitinophaga dinghuensis TaxID=1539050 RepID=A0A327W4H6_9BACT|nr:gliding motility-associated-like protein [Chitinophaga dinghuensis]
MGTYAMKYCNQFRLSFFIFCLLLLAGISRVQAQNVVIKADNTSGCVPMLVSFTATLDPGYTSYEWSFDQGSTINNLLTPKKTFDVPKTYHVTFTANYPSGAITKSLDIAVHDVPKALFSGATTIACQHTTLSFTDQSSTPEGTVTSVEWDMGDGTLIKDAQGKTVSHKFDASGQYNISSIVTNNWGCRTSSTPLPITIRTAPEEPTFEAVKPGSCSAPFDVTFINKTPDPNKEFTFTYDYGDGATGTSPNHTYAKPGTYTVTLTATNGDCTSSKTLKNYISIGNLKASFTYSNACQGQLVQFTNTSTPTPTSSIWTFPDLTTATTLDAQHAIPYSGSSVVLSVTLDGCTDVYYMPITLYPQPTDIASATPNNTCAIPASTKFSVTNSNSVSWSWNFGDGSPTDPTPNTTHSYTANNLYTATLTATTANGCKAVTPVVLDYSLPTVTISPSKTEGCIPLDVTFNTFPFTRPGETITSYSWDFGDGTTGTGATPMHTYLKEGNFTVILTFTTNNGCTNTATTTLKAGFKPVVDFSADPAITCAKDPVNFTNLSQPRGTSWAWQFMTDEDDPRTPENEMYSSLENPTHYFRTVGKQTVQLEVDNYGCKNKLIKYDIVNVTAPIAKWKSTPDCDDPMNRKFKDQSQWGTTDATLPHIQEWNFGDGTPTLTATDPVHTYAKQGRYKVSLKVSNTVCDNEFADSIYVVNQSPTISASQTAVCIGNALALTATIPDPTLQLGYVIDWGDLNSLHYDTWNAAFFHTYATPGVYKIQVTTYDLNNCKKESNIISVTVNGPIPAFTFSGKPCRNSDITFTDNSSMNAGNQLVSWKWNFGDNTPPVTVTKTPVVNTHQYANDGGYTVTLQVTDKYNCTASATRFVQLENHKANFTMSTNEPCVNDPRIYYNTSNGAFNFKWDFGDGTTSITANPVKAFTAPGNYEIKLQITTPGGCVDETSQKLRVPDPKADFTMPQDMLPCPPVNVKFTNTSVDFERSKWDFGDGTSTGNNNPDGHIYSRPKTYDITLTVYTREGCSNQIKKSITVDGPDGTATINLNKGCAPLDINLTATAIKTVKYVWDFDDGIVETTTIPTSPLHTYTNAGIFTPRVILTDSKGCEVPAIISGTVTVDKPVIDFDIDKSMACGGGLVKFTNKTKTLTEDVLSMPYTSSWDFGQPGSPGNNTTARNPTFNYPGPGSRTVKLNITTAFGCPATLTKTVIIPEQPKASIDRIPDICETETVTISGKETKGVNNVKWTWNVSNNITNNNTTPFSYNGNTPGTIPVILTITNADGSCPDIANAQFIVHPTPLLSPTPALANVCRGSSLMLSANTDFNSAVLWTNYNIDNPTSKTPLVSPDKDITYSVIATSPFGCKNEKSVALTVTQPFTISTSDHITCFGGSVQLNVTGADHYTWSPAIGLNRTDIPNPIATPQITTNYNVSGFDKYNCFEMKATAHVTVNPKPAVDAGPDITQSNGSIIPLHVKVSEDVTRIKWTPTENLSCSNCTNPTLTPKGDATYYVEVTNGYGCTNMDDINVKIICDNSNIFIPNTFSPNKDGVNDIFYIRGRGVQEVKSMKIFNRWGQLIFERYSFPTDDITKGWDGTFKGQMLPPDVYVYFAEVVCDKGGLGLLKGNLTLLR